MIASATFGVASRCAMVERHEDIASALPPDLDALPRAHGFRLRGMEMTRLETFIDAAFAFAVTMMVIGGQQIPTDVATLLDAFKNVPAFITSTLVLGIFWRGHWKWSRRYGLEDGVSILISWAMLVTILIYIYPLKVVFDSMWYFLSNHRFGRTITAQTNEQVRQLFAIYALGFIAIALQVLLLNLRAWQLREPLRLDARERAITLAEIGGWCVPLGVGLISLVLALTMPPERIAWSGWVYFSLAILMRLYSRFVKRRRRLMAA